MRKLRMLILNLAGIAGLVVAARQELFHILWESDPTKISFGILGLFLLTWFYSMYRLWKPGPIEQINTNSGHMVNLGLIGTVVGFIIAFSGVDPSQVGNPTSVGPMVGTLIQGMGVALYTTLVGATSGMWTYQNYRALGGENH